MATTLERARVANLAAVWRNRTIYEGLTKREQEAIASWARTAEIEVPVTVARALARVPDLREKALAAREDELARLRAEVERLRAAQQQAAVQAETRQEGMAQTPAETQANSSETVDEERRKLRWLGR